MATNRCSQLKILSDELILNISRHKTPNTTVATWDFGMTPLNGTTAERVEFLQALRSIVEYASFCAATLENKALEDAISIAHTELEVELDILHLSNEPAPNRGSWH